MTVNACIHVCICTMGVCMYTNLTKNNFFINIMMITVPFSLHLSLPEMIWIAVEQSECV